MIPSWGVSSTGSLWNEPRGRGCERATRGRVSDWNVRRPRRRRLEDSACSVEKTDEKRRACAYRVRAEASSEG
ncbi:hypothetical protein BC628DRAFT_1401368 [Trametes gibbosa]|nr:hypothetical protein BC628DRAFT_1401368 [Trametes gibbosa]